MENHKYRLVKAKPSFPSIDLIIDEANKESPKFALFGPNSYSENQKEMQKTYSHSADYPLITFIPATTSQSISAASYDVADIKEKVLDPRWLQLSYIVRTSEGVFANPLNEQGNPITDEKTLKSLLNKAEKINGIYLLPNDFGFAPHETFKQGEQSSADFANGGLARLLENTKANAIKLSRISSPKFYPKGVYVGGFDKTNVPVLRVVSLYSGRYLDCYRLYVVGLNSVVNGYGFAFGVSPAGEASTRKK